jgi:hypothetical protein
MIELIPERRASKVRASLKAKLAEHSRLKEDELVVIGLQHLANTCGAQDKRTSSSSRTSQDKASEGQASSNRTYTIIAVGDHAKMSTRGRSVDEAIIIADEYRKLGATMVLIKTPDGRRYSSDEVSRLLRLSKWPE